MRPSTSSHATRRALVALVLGALVALLSSISLAPASAQEPIRDSLTVVMTEMEPFVMNDDGDPEGFYAEIWDEVAASLDIEYEVLWVDSFGELLPAIEAGRADVAVAPLAPTAEREAQFDFTSAVLASGPQIGITDRLESRPSLIRSMFDPRVLSLIAMAFIGLLLLAHAIWLFERGRHEEDGDFHSSYLQGIWDGFWWSTVTATTVGYGDKAPKSFGGRLIALIAMLSSLVLVGAFVSQVTSIMAEDLRPNVETLDDVTGQVGVVRGSSFAAYVEAQGAQVVAFDTQAQVFQAAADGQVDAVIANPFALATLNSRFGVTAVGDVLYEEFETFGVEQGSPLREPINQALADMQSSGEIAEIIKDGLN